MPLQGMRDITEEEVKLLDHIKGVSERIEELVNVIAHRSETDQRWASIARGDLQKGLMSLERSVLKPKEF